MAIRFIPNAADRYYLTKERDHLKVLQQGFHAVWPSSILDKMNALIDEINSHLDQPTEGVRADAVKENQS